VISSPAEARVVRAFPKPIGYCTVTFDAGYSQMFEGIQISIEVPFGYSQRDQLLGFMESKFPGAQISIVHIEASSPTIAEVLVSHHSTTESEKTASTGEGPDSEAVLLRASDALTEFTKSASG
jgi:hypothetical protein